MSTKIDLNTQVQGVLPRLHGGSGNMRGAAHDWLMVTVVNDSGATIDLGKLVTKSAAGSTLHETIVTGEAIIGVVVGRLSPTTGLFEEVAPDANEIAAIAIAGRVVCNVTTAAARGDYVRTSTTAGAATPSSSPQSGAFGWVLQYISSSKALIILGTTSAPSVATIDHGELLGLDDDDHSAYVTVVDGGGETLNVVASAGATETIDAADGNVHDVTLDADCVLTLTGATVGVVCALTILLREDGSGGWNVTWPGSVVWPSGVTPTLDTTASAVNVFTLFTLDGGSEWLGFQVGAAATPEPPAPTPGGELLINDDHSTPLVFDDILQNDDQDDFLYSEG